MTRKVSVSASNALEPLLRFTKHETVGDPGKEQVKEVNSTLFYGAVPTASLPGLSASQAGSIAFDSTLAKLVVWTGAAWETVTSA